MNDTTLSSAIAKKAETVEQLTDQIKKSRSIVLANYSGITHKQLETLRKAFKKLGAELAVVKNTLFMRAFKEIHADTTLPELREPSAVLFSYEDEVAALKELTKFFKTAGLGTVKFGFLDAQVLTDTQVNRLAELPDKQTLRAQLVGQLKAPLYGLHNALSWNMRRLVWVLDGIKNKK